MNTKQITEKDGEQDKWYAEAKTMTADKLPAFVNKLINEYGHDYGTICHAIAAAGIAAMWAVENSDQGGITGFQASCITWEILRNWQHIDGPARIVEYRDMLFPQYDNKFKQISKETWAYLQEEAAKSLASETRMNPRVQEHMQSIVDGVVPFGMTVEA